MPRPVFGDGRVFILTGFQRGDGAAKAFIELLGAEKVLDEKRQKRAELRAKKTEEARKAKYQGTVLLYVQVDPSGKATNIRVLHSLGLGLDEKAMERVKTWLFEPGKKDGQAVAVAMNIEVDFHLY